MEPSYVCHIGLEIRPVVFKQWDMSSVHYMIWASSVHYMIWASSFLFCISFWVSYFAFFYFPIRASSPISVDTILFSVVDEHAVLRSPFVFQIFPFSSHRNRFNAYFHLDCSHSMDSFHLPLHLSSSIKIDIPLSYKSLDGA